jgi:hypothetical protein
VWFPTLLYVEGTSGFEENNRIFLCFISHPYVLGDVQGPDDEFEEESANTSAETNGLPCNR